MRTKLYIARREKRKTQEDIANVIGISRSAYNYKELGKSDFFLKEAQLLAKYFEMSLDELFSN